MEKYGIDNYNWKPEIAKEIATLYEGWYPGEFIVWIGYSCGFGDLSYRKIDNDWVYMNKAYTLPDLFKYWLNYLHNE